MRETIKKYVLYHNREDFEKKLAVGVFTEETLIEYALNTGLRDTALVMDFGFLSKIKPFRDIEFLKPYLSADSEPAKPQVAQPLLTEQQIREAYYKSQGTYRDLTHEIWPALKRVSGGREFSVQEVAAFIHGMSVYEIVQDRKNHGAKLNAHFNRPVGTVTPKANEPVGIMDQIAAIPAFLWVIMVAMLLVALALVFPSEHKPTRPLTADEQLTQAAVILQRRIEKQDREQREKFEKEYRRQEREGR